MSFTAGRGQSGLQDGVSHREMCAEGSASQAWCTEGSVGSFAKLGHQIPSFELLELGEGPTLHLPKCSTKSDHSKGFGRVEVKVASKS